MSIKKVLFLITQGELGGAQRYVLDLATNLPRDQFLPVVAQGSEDLSLKNELEKRGVKAVVLPHLIRAVSPHHDILAAKEIINLIRREQPDIVHANSTKAGLLGSFIAHRLGVPKIIFTAHGWVFNEPGPLKQFYLWAEKIGAKHKHKIICVSEYDRQAALKYGVGKPEQLITIHNGVNENLSLQAANYELRKETRAELASLLGEKINDNDILVGTIAHNYKTKDLPTLYHAFDLAKEKVSNLKLAVIGKGSKIGALPNAGRFLPAFDIYALSSVKEGLPYSLLEALSAGLPVVATNVGGVPEIVRDGQEGLLVPPKNPHTLADAIGKLAQDEKQRQSMGLAAASRAKRFSLEQMIEKTQDIYLG